MNTVEMAMPKINLRKGAIYNADEKSTHMLEYMCILYKKKIKIAQRTLHTQQWGYTARYRPAGDAPHFPLRER